MELKAKASCKGGTLKICWPKRDIQEAQKVRVDVRSHHRSTRPKSGCMHQ